MNSPPKKAPGAGELTGRELIAARGYQARPLIQVGIIWSGWEREAKRLFLEFWRTGNRKHLTAFYRHIIAMRAHQAGGAQ